jgi:citrate synthase
MTGVDPAHVIHTSIWREEPEPDNPFATRAAYCRGYDVFGQMVGRARWVEMLYLLLRDSLPDAISLDLLEALAVALANPGPRDQSVHAAMAGGVAGSTAAASLIAALSVGAGRYGGARDVFDMMQALDSYGTELAAWEKYVPSLQQQDIDIFPEHQHPPGFEGHALRTASSVQQCLEQLASIGGTPRLQWLSSERAALERLVGCPLALTGVAAAAFADLDLSPKEGEMLFLLLRLPGAAAHALEQEALGYKRFPFYPVELQDDPGIVQPAAERELP